MPSLPSSSTLPLLLPAPTNPRPSPRARSSIDSLLLRDRDESSAWTASADSTPETRSYYVQNWRNDVVAMTIASGRITEWARYSAYGEARVRSRILGDYDGDGDIDADDSNAFFTDWNNSTGNADVDEDGDHDSDDITLFAAAWDNAHEGWQTGLSLEATSGNRLGYAGYHLDPATSQYHVRHRVYIPTLGRWTKRDPLGNIDGMSVYGYVGSNPAGSRDSLGLFSSRPCTSNVGCQPGAIAPPEVGDPPGPVPTPQPPISNEGCSSCAQMAMAEPRNAAIITEMQRRGCGFSFSGCETCGSGVPADRKGWTDQDGTVHLCGNRMPSCEYAQALLSHELWHAYDMCQGHWPPGTPSCCDCVCYELRAYRWDGGCKAGGSRRRLPGPGGMPPPQSESECLRMYVGVSCGFPGYPCGGVASTLDPCFSEMYMRSECSPVSVFPSPPVTKPGPILEI